MSSCGVFKLDRKRLATLLPPMINCANVELKHRSYERVAFELCDASPNHFSSSLGPGYGRAERAQTQG